MATNKETDILKDENAKLKELHAVKSDIVSVSAHQIRTSLSALKWIVKMTKCTSTNPLLLHLIQK